MKSILFRSIALWLSLVCLSSAQAPPWWQERGITTGAPSKNKAVANVGQFKNFIKQTLIVIKTRNLELGNRIETNLEPLLGRDGVSLPISPDQEWLNKQRRPLKGGQLKAVVKEIYDELHAFDANWLAEERVRLGTNISGSLYPWSATTGDDKHHAPVTLGQLKACFALDFSRSSKMGPVQTPAPGQDSDGDGMTDEYELQNPALSPYDASDANADHDKDGLPTTAERILGSDPAQADQVAVIPAVRKANFVLSGGDISSSGSEFWTFQLTQTSGQPAQDPQIFKADPGAMRHFPVELQEGSVYELRVLWYGTNIDPNNPDHDWALFLSTPNAPQTLLPTTPVLAPSWGGASPIFEMVSDGLTFTIDNQSGLAGQHVDGKRGDSDPVFHPSGVGRGGPHNSVNDAKDRVVIISSGSKETYASVCLKARDLANTPKNEAVAELWKGDGETLALRQDENGYYQVRLSPEVAPKNQAGDYVVTLGLPALWLDEAGALQKGKATVEFSADRDSDFRFALPQGSSSPSSLYARIDKRSGSNEQPICKVNLSLGDCESCSSCAPGTTETSSDAHNGASFNIDAGDTGNGRGGASLISNADDLFHLASPQNLQVSASSGAIVDRDEKTGALKSVSTAHGVLRVENAIPASRKSLNPDALEYSINFYDRNSLGELSTTPATQLLIKGRNLRSKTTPKEVILTEQRYDNNPSDGQETYVQTKFKQSSLNGVKRWVHLEGADVQSLTTEAADGQFLRQTERYQIPVANTSFNFQGKTVAYPTRQDLIIVSERRADNSRWEQISVTRETWVEFPWGLTQTKRERIHGERTLTDVWEYYLVAPSGQKTTAIDYHSGRLRRMIRHDGSWTEYQYDSQGRVSQIIRPYLNSTPGSPADEHDVTTYVYSTNTPYLSTTRTLNNNVVSKVWQTSQVSNGLIVSTQERATKLNAQFGNASNLVSSRQQHVPQVNEAGMAIDPRAGQSSKTISPDGTGMICFYSTRTNGDWVKDCRTGAFNGSKSDIVRGTKSVTTYDQFGNVRSEQVYSLDFQGVAGNQQLLYTHSVAKLDTLGRPVEMRKIFADRSPTQITTKKYGCCGLRSSTDIRGITTLYHYDHLKRLETSESLGVVSGTQFNGRTVRQVRIPKAATAFTPDGHGHLTVRGPLHADAMILSESESNTAGETIATRSASPQHTDGRALVETTYQYHYGANQPFAAQPRGLVEGRGTTVLTTYPDQGTSLRQSYIDGRPRLVVGTAEDDTTYEYQLGGLLVGSSEVVFSTITRKGERAVEAAVVQNLAVPSLLTVSGIDAAGRTKVVAEGSRTYLQGRTVYDYDATTGLLNSITDGDGVVTLFGYNAEAERTHTATDLNNNGQIDDTVDRIQFQETDYWFASLPSAITNGSSRAIVRRSVSKVYRDFRNLNSNLSVFDPTVQETNRVETSVDGFQTWEIPFGDPNAANHSLTVIDRNNQNWVTTVTQATGLTTVSSYLGGLLDHTFARGSSGPAISRVDYRYDRHNRIEKTIDSRTGETSVVFYNNDQTQQQTLLRAGTNRLVTRYDYDTMGRYD